MNYLEAKTVLSIKPPEFSWRVIMIEAAVMIGTAGILVRLFA